MINIGPYELMAWCECGNRLGIDSIGKKGGRITYVSIGTTVCPQCGSENYEVFVAREIKTIEGSILRVYDKKIEKLRRVYATFPEKKPSP